MNGEWIALKNTPVTNKAAQNIGLQAYLPNFGQIFQDMLLDRLTELDWQVTLAVNSMHSPLTDSIWKFFSSVPVWIPMYAVVAGCLFWRLGWKRGLVFTVVLGLMVLCCDQFANFIKHSVQRLRPCHEAAMVAAGLHAPRPGGMYGFFSGHAANTFGFAAASLTAFRTDRRLKYRGYAAWIYTWCSLVSISRVFLGMHYVGDITVGAIAGTLIGLALAFSGRYFCKRFI